MNTQDQIKVLAELDGVTKNNEILGRYNHNGFVIAAIPDYLHSHDAIIPLIEKHILHKPIDTALLEKFWNALNDITDFFETGGHLWMLKSSPAQLCEALLRATGKWKE